MKYKSSANEDLQVQVVLSEVSLVKDKEAGH